MLSIGVLYEYLRTHVHDGVDLFRQDLFRQPKCRNIRSHQPAGFALLLEDRHSVTERQ